MSIHTPPSTYILRKMVDVSVPDSVVWWPQTVGWKILAAAIMLVCFVLLYRRAKYWWNNRYRQEAISALNTLNPTTPPQTARALFSLLKKVMTYLDPKKASLFGEPLLNELDKLYPSTHFQFNSDIGKAWLASTLTTRQSLSESELVILIGHTRMWLAEHQVSTRGENG
ncbi:DUF4381 domain-containing protein [Photobacterium minamisatsumaniensis]|uniref:DUF4381 domain-containing protein n=1 Tax=Photobacterium minamisatsumaniensis TaxID=2910233 RepID=UPI003D0A12E8